jgi:guanylate cyclase
MVLDGELVIPLLVDVCQGLSFLHSSKPPLIHSDLKAANVLVDSKFRAKVADFGALSGKKAVGACGTPFWMAPELLLEQLNSLKSDVYAFGIMVWEVYARQDPYVGEDPDAVLKQVANVHATPETRPEIPEDCPLQVQEIMKAAWHNDPTLRPAFSELEKMLQRLDTNSKGTRVNGGDEENQTRLLNDVFPKHIADKLRKDEKIEPKKRECVTIFFSDIVGFIDIFAASGVQLAQSTSRLFHFRRAAFSATLKVKVGSTLAKTAALRINLNIDGAPITAKAHTHPSHSQTSRLLTSFLSLGVPVSRATQCMRGV